jgi:protein-L-isoaspartate(D-aspartate) O-methyltransferase
MAGSQGARLRFAMPCRTTLPANMGIQRMFDTANARRLMVEGQVRTADVTDGRVLDAMLTLPRERFLPPPLVQLAYVDGDIPVARGRSLLKPMVLAKLVQAARIGSGDRVLDVGCATGYSSALLARLAASVMALEEDANLAGMAREALAAVGATNVEVMTGPLIAGWPAGAPYDVILVEGSSEIAPEALGAQLKPDGRLLGIHGGSPASKAMIYHRIEGHLVGRPIFDAAARLLPGFAAPPQFVF